MKIYHFIDSKHGLMNIEGRHLKVSDLMSLNDPFEFLGVDTADEGFRHALIKAKKDLAKDKGIICFSKDWTNPVQWSHYADKHKGLCLGFDVPSHLLTKIIYKSKRLERPKAINEDFMKRLLSIKFSHWKYEKEYRIFTTLENKKDGLCFRDFSDALSLKQVIVGAESEVTREELNLALGDLSESVDVFKARTAFRSFMIVEQKNISLW